MAIDPGFDEPPYDRLVRVGVIGGMCGIIASRAKCVVTGPDWGRGRRRFSRLAWGAWSRHDDFDSGKHIRLSQGTS